MNERRRSMKSAPKDGTMLILTVEHGWSGEDVEIPGAWMMPGGDKSLLGWWAAGLIRVNGSELPQRIRETFVLPKKWRPLTDKFYKGA